jgi:hypothetical protein
MKCLKCLLLEVNAIKLSNLSRIIIRNNLLIHHRMLKFVATARGQKKSWKTELFDLSNLKTIHSYFKIRYHYPIISDIKLFSNPQTFLKKLQLKFLSNHFIGKWRNWVIRLKKFQPWSNFVDKSSIVPSVVILKDKILLTPVIPHSFW